MIERESAPESAIRSHRPLEAATIKELLETAETTLDPEKFKESLVSSKVGYALEGVPGEARPVAIYETGSELEELVMNALIKRKYRSNGAHGTTSDGVKHRYVKEFVDPEEGEYSVIDLEESIVKRDSTQTKKLVQIIGIS